MVTKILSRLSYNLKASHLSCYLIFLKKVECLNEVTVVHTVEKKWSVVLKMGELVQVLKQKDPNLHITHKVNARNCVKLMHTIGPLK